MYFNEVKTMWKDRKPIFWVILLSFAACAAVAVYLLINSMGHREKFTGEKLCYIKAYDRRALTLDEIEWVTEAERAGELGLDKEDMPNGFYIYNERELEEKYFFAEDCRYTVLDWYGGFRVLELDKESFLDLLKSREANFRTLPPFIVEMTDGKIVSVTEHYVP